MATLAQLQMVGNVTESGNAPSPANFAAEVNEVAGGMYEAGMYEAGMYEAGGSSLPTFDGGIDTGIIDNLLPRDPGRVQLTGRFKIEVDGAEVPPAQIVEGVQVTERLDGARSFSFSMAARNSPRTEYWIPDLGDPRQTEFTDPFGPEWVGTWTGAPPGKDNITITYLAPTTSLTSPGYESIPIITNGIIENAVRNHSVEGDFWQLNGVGREQRADRQLVDIVIPPGSGVTPGELLKKILELVPELENDTIPEFDVADSPCYVNPRRDKEVQVTDRSGWQAANEILGLWNFRLHFDRDGNLAITYMGERPEDYPDWSFSLSDVMSEGLTFAPANDGPTRVRCTGSEQITTESSGGVRTEVQVVEIESIYAPVVAAQKISNSAGDLIDTGADSGDPTLRLTSRTTYTREFNLDSLISETIDIEGYHIEEMRAGLMSSSDGSISYDVGRKIWQNTLATPWPQEWFVDISQEITSYSFSTTTVDGETVQVQTGIHKEIIRNRWTKRYVANITSAGALDWVTAHVSWQGEGMTGLSNEGFNTTEEQTTEYDITPDLYIKGEKVTTEKWAIWPGNNRYYSTGETSAYTEEQYGVVEVRDSQYSPSGDDASVRVTTYKDLTGKVVQVATEELDSYLPAARIKEATRADLTEYPNAHWASRNKSEAFEVLYISEALELNRQAYEEQVSNAWLEDAEEAMCYAGNIVKERSTIPVSWTMPLNPLIQPGQKINLPLGIRPYGNEGIESFSTVSCYVTEATHHQAPGIEPSTTTVIGKVYVV